MFELFNQQNTISIDSTPLNRFAQKAIAAVKEAKNKSLSVVLVSDKKIVSLNQEFRNKDSPTDVLSFPHESDDFEPNTNYLGDIVISAEQAQKQATENNHSIELEIKQLILHGILHLCGYDHETDKGEMNELELKLRDRLEINE